jgi:hypothetical protein
MSNILQQIGAAVKGKVDGVQANVAAEETARIAAITAEATSRGAADTTLQSNIDAEATTARAAESTLTTNLSSEESARIAAVTAEASSRASADTSLQSNIDSEATTARAAEAVLTTAVSDEETRAVAAEAVLTSAVSAEETARIAAVSGEATSRASADSALQSEIDAEEVRAAAAEGVLTSNLATEVTDRQTAVSAEASTRAAAVTNLDTVKANLSGAAFTGAVSGTDLTLSGNLTVTGTTTSIETVNSQVKDSIMLLNDGAAGSSNNANDVGLIMERGSSEDNVALVFDEGEDKFVCYKTSAAASSTDISGDDSSATLMDIKVSDVYVGADNLGSYSDFSVALG